METESESIDHSRHCWMEILSFLQRYNSLTLFFREFIYEATTMWKYDILGTWHHIRLMPREIKPSDWLLISHIEQSKRNARLYMELLFLTYWYALHQKGHSSQNPTRVWLLHITKTEDYLPLVFFWVPIDRVFHQFHRRIPWNIANLYDMTTYSYFVSYGIFGTDNIPEILSIATFTTLEISHELSYRFKWIWYLMIVKHDWRV